MKFQLINVKKELKFQDLQLFLFMIKVGLLGMYRSDLYDYKNETQNKLSFSDED